MKVKRKALTSSVVCQLGKTVKSNADHDLHCVRLGCRYVREGEPVCSQIAKILDLEKLNIDKILNC